MSAQSNQSTESAAATTAQAEPLEARAFFEYLASIGNRLATPEEMIKLTSLMDKAKGGPYLDPEQGARMREKLVASGAIKIEDEAKAQNQENGAAKK
jgi:hypothetical protein